MGKGAPVGNSNAKKPPRKPQKYRSVKAFHLPKDPKRYAAQKLQHLIRQYEKMADKEPWNVDPKKYIELLNSFTQLSVEIAKERKDKRVKERVDSQRVATKVPSGGSARVRKDEPFSLDS